MEGVRNLAHVVKHWHGAFPVNASEFMCWVCPVRIAAAASEISCCNALLQCCCMLEKARQVQLLLHALWLTPARQHKMDVALLR